MGFLKGVGTFFLSLLLIFTIFFASIGVTFYSTLLYPEIYQEALEKIDAEKLIQEKFPIEDSRIPVPKELAPENIKATLLLLISNTLAYARSDTDELTFVISINQDNILSFFEQQAQAFPVCSNNQLPFENGEPKCRPADIPTKEFLMTVLEQKNFSVDKISNPDLIQVFDPQNNRVKLRQYVTWFRYGLYASLLLILLLMFFIWLLRRKSIKSFSRTIGVNFALIGGMLLGVFFIANQIPITHLPGEIAGYVLPVVDVFKNAILSKIFIFGIVLALIGVIAFVYSFIKKENIGVIKENVKGKTVKKKKRK